ncbi:MAG: hypothetical protein GEU75_15295 [Dehalococcoidia bacterium]|nr:hypothetical protein [Dehalococcoidia bacterium]
MNTPSGPSQENPRRDAANWAQPVQKLQVQGMPAEAPNLVDGRRLVGPLQGFGKMWQKTYRVRLEDASVTPPALIETWKANFSSLWPRGNRFYTPLTGIAPGEVALISLAAGPMKLSTGVMVLYADAESFTLMTPQGHMFAGWITFSAFDAPKEGASQEGEGAEAACCVAQVQVLMRAQDPLSEIGLALGGHKAEDRFWSSTLRALAARFDSEAEPEIQIACVDPRRRWTEAKNVWHNAGIRSGLYVAGAPLRWLRRSGKRDDAG